MVNFFKRLVRSIQRQIAIVLAIADYDLDRKSTGELFGELGGSD